MNDVQVALGRNLPLLFVATALSAIVLGLLMATSPLFGVAALIAIAYVPVVMISLPVGIALWIPLAFLEGIPGTSSLPEAGGIVIVGTWFALAARRGSFTRQGLWLIRRQIIAMIALVAWLTFSLVWAGDPSATINLAVSWGLVALLSVVVASSLLTPRDVRLSAWAFVAGALISVLVGAAGLAAGLSGFDVEGRFQAAAGDPNYLGAQLIAALAMAAGLFGTARVPRDRIILAMMIVPLLVALIASQSRGALVGLVIAAIAALILFPGSRSRVVASILAMVTLLAIAIALNPSAMERFTSSGDRGSGRTDLWTVSWRMIEEHPILGVGLSNFGDEAVAYTREPGQLENVQHVLRGQEPHNLYLGLYAETGLAGVGLFIVVAGFSFSYAARASGVFERLGLNREEILVRATAVGLIGMLATSFFLPNGTDKRMWIMLGLLGAAYVVAMRIELLTGRPSGTNPLAEGTGPQY